MPLPTFAALGSGPLVLLLHGSGGGFRSFAPQVETLASLGWRAVAWDMPGYGYSAPIEPYTFKGLAERCIALIEALAPPAARPPWWGRAWAACWPRNLRCADPTWWAGWCWPPRRRRSSRATPTRHIAQCQEALAAGTDLERIAQDRVAGLSGPQALPEGLQLARFCQAQVRAATWRRALAAMQAFDRRAALAHIGVPALLVAGERPRHAAGGAAGDGGGDPRQRPGRVARRGPLAAPGGARCLRPGSAGVSARDAAGARALSVSYRMNS
jgi:pimeloyl-ACP methyl ester carboxylesterase